MPMNFLSVTPRNERRVRLLFDNSPAAGAYGSSSSTLAFYSVTSTDNLSSAIGVSSAIVVAGLPNAVDIAFNADLVQSSNYTLTVTALPCTDASTATGTLPFSLGTQYAGQPNQEVPADDYASLLYGNDLSYGDLDFIETSSGDLATITGLSNVQQAVRLRLFGDGLPWDPTWGAKPRQYVDGTTGSMSNLRATLVQQATADDRVQSAIATLSTGYPDPTGTFQAYFYVQVTLVGGEIVSPIQVQIPV